MLEVKELPMLHEDYKVGMSTATGSVVLKTSYTVKDIRRLQKFLHEMLEKKSRIKVEQ